MNKLYLSLSALLAACSTSPSTLPPTVELGGEAFTVNKQAELDAWWRYCPLSTSDAADDTLRVAHGWRRPLSVKKNVTYKT